jgi:hypothetical protein
MDGGKEQGRERGRGRVPGKSCTVEGRDDVGRDRLLF